MAIDQCRRSDAPSARAVDQRTRELVHAATVDIVAASADPRRDMREERARASFSSDNLAAFMNGGKVRLLRDRFDHGFALDNPC